MLFIPIKSEVSHEDVEEAGYLASASDLMVGLLFVFIIMVVILSQRVEQVTNENESKNKDPLESAVITIGQRMKNAGVPVTIDPSTGVITLPADTLFPSGVAELNANGVEVLSKARLSLDEILPCYIFSERNKRNNCPANPSEAEIETIFIEGHTDSKPLQKGIYTNWHLGLDRARAVYEVLTAGSMISYKNERDLNAVGISSYADKRPAKGGLFDDSKNRRVELRFVLAYKADNIQQNIQQNLNISATRK
jgi:flagellar motor protein MotB